MWDMFRGGREDPEDEDRITLRALFEDLKQTVSYLYDFGDSWKHGIKLIDTHEARSAFAHLPICLAGARAAPPEDSGGIWGFEEKVQILRNPDPNDSWHQEVMEWMGGAEFDPEAFDVNATNRQIGGTWSTRPARSSSPRRGPTKRRKRKSR